MTRGRTIVAGLAVAVLAAPGLVWAGDAEMDGLWGRDRLTGEWGGARTALAESGLEIGIDYVGEAIANVSGGLKRGSVYEGVLELALDADLQALAGWTGATAHASMFQIHGHGPSYLVGGNLLGVSGIEALPTTRLNTLWLEQSLLDEQVSVRLGQLAADDEFFTSDGSGYLVNGNFGWGAIFGPDMTSGGPNYPLPSPGVRVQVAPAPAPAVTILAGVFAADPAGADCMKDDPQECNRHGTTFSLSGGTLWIGEVQYALDAGGLPGIYKLGGWYETGKFEDQRYGLDASGTRLSLADEGAENPLFHNGNYGIHAVADQMVWREPGSDAQGLSLFAGAGGTQADRNLVTFYATGGFTYMGPIPSRDDDVLVLGAAYAGVSSDASDFDREARADDAAVPVRDREVDVELTYILALAPWWFLQGDLQYIIHPGGNVQNPHNSIDTIEDTLLLGLRTGIAF
jgi:porin